LETECCNPHVYGKLEATILTFAFWSNNHTQRLFRTIRNTSASVKPIL